MNAISQINGGKTPTLLCLASYEKGHRFLAEAKELGCHVYLLTSSMLQDAPWPRESLDDILFLPGDQSEWNLEHMLAVVARLCRHIKLDRVVALDDFDLEKAALIREHFRIPGMGESSTRYFRDKLAMRTGAHAGGIRVPAFTSTTNYIDITRFVDSVSPPWVLKPRLMAGAIGISKIASREEAWERVHALGDQQSFYVLEQFVPGDIFHVDSIWSGGQAVCAFASVYGTPPLEVTQSGGVFTTRLLPRNSKTSDDLCGINESVLQLFGLKDGVSHTEFIRSKDTGEFLFLETSARVGGAHIPELIEAGTGVNLWAEWAKIECSIILGSSYSVPEVRNEYAGLLVSLARQEWPDTSVFSDPEIVWKLTKRHHVGLVVKSSDNSRVAELMDTYIQIVRKDFHASVPPREKVGL
ncbi:MAG: acetyl-CoA carboxylase biotin carboxylase subunit family protein [Bryobacteraceae bacterium]